MSEVNANDKAVFSDKDQVEPAQSPYGTAMLPYGLCDDNGAIHKQIEFRELTGHEEDILAAKKMAVLSRMQKIMERCLQKIGPYTQKDKEWSRYVLNLSAADRLFVLREIRVLSLGRELRYKIQCPSCEKSDNYVFDLMDIKFEVPSEGKRHWEGVLPRSGKKYSAKIQTGVEEQKLQDYLSGNDALTAGIWCRLIELDGKNPVPFHDVKMLGTFDRQFLRDEFKKNEISIDSEIEMTCRFCGHEFREDVDMGQASFFFPTATSN